MRTLSREVRVLGYGKLLARPKHHAHAAGAIEAFKKNFPATLAGIAREQGLGLDPVEIWFADKARLGQKNGITRRWARCGTGPAAPQDQRDAATYIFGAVCPREGKGAALVLPFCNTAAMNLHLAEIGERVSPGKHAVLLLHQAGWHLSGDVAVSDNITLRLLPPECPELNVTENVWLFMRDNWRSRADLPRSESHWGFRHAPDV
jgi:hypothetical protein